MCRERSALLAASSQVCPAAVRLLKDGLPSSFCPLVALRGLGFFKIFFQDSIVVICRRGKSDSATVLLPEVLILFRSFHFFDDTSVCPLVVALFSLQSLCIFTVAVSKSLSSRPILTAGSSLGLFLLTDTDPECGSHFPVVVCSSFLMKRCGHSGFCHFPLEHIAGVLAHSLDSACSAAAARQPLGLQAAAFLREPRHLPCAHTGKGQV